MMHCNIYGQPLVAPPWTPCYQPPGFEGRARRGPALTRLHFRRNRPFEAGVPLPCGAAVRNTTRKAKDLADDSNTGDVGARYARALLDLAVDSGVVEAVEKDLAALKVMLGGSSDLRTLIASPKFTAEEKAKGLIAVADRAGACDTTRRFLGVLTANRRAGALAAAIAAFERLAAERRGLVAAEVVTAAPLTKDQAKALAETLAHAIGREPRIDTRIDPAILGGLKVRVGSRLYDASLKTKLDSLKFALKRA